MAKLSKLNAIVDEAAQLRDDWDDMQVWVHPNWIERSQLGLSAYGPVGDLKVFYFDVPRGGFWVLNDREKLLANVRQFVTECVKKLPVNRAPQA